MKDRIIFLGTSVDDQAANAIMAQLLHLESEDPEQDINLYINLYINSPDQAIEYGVIDNISGSRPRGSPISGRPVRSSFTPRRARLPAR